MTKENQLKVLEIIINIGGLEGNKLKFHDSYIKRINVSYKEFNDFVVELIEKNYINSRDWDIDLSIHILQQNLISEIENEKKLMDYEASKKIMKPN